MSFHLEHFRNINGSVAVNRQMLRLYFLCFVFLGRQLNSILNGMASLQRLSFQILGMTRGYLGLFATENHKEITFERKLFSEKLFSLVIRGGGGLLVKCS